MYQVSERVIEQRSVLQTKKKKANWIGQLLHRNRLLKYVVEGKIEGKKDVARRRGGRRKKLLDNINKKGENTEN
jgi:hypothetical protein